MLQSNEYVDFKSPESDEINFKTICDSNLYTDQSCRTNLINSLTSSTESIYGPIKGDKFGMIDDKKKILMLVNGHI